MILGVHTWCVVYVQNNWRESTLSTTWAPDTEFTLSGWWRAAVLLEHLAGLLSGFSLEQEQGG